MSASQAKVVLDKLLKIYEPLKDAQKLLTELEAGEQNLKEVSARVAAASEELARKKEELSTAQHSIEIAKQERDRVLSEADTEARAISAAAAGEAHDALEKMEVAKATLQRDVDTLRAELVQTEHRLAERQEELKRVTALATDQRKKLEQALTAI